MLRILLIHSSAMDTLLLDILSLLFMEHPGKGSRQPLGLQQAQSNFPLGKLFFVIFIQLPYLEPFLQVSIQ